MSDQRFINVAQLRELLLGMERDLGIGDLSQNEKDILYTISLVSSVNRGIARSDVIKAHDLVAGISQPTFHRCLKNLVKAGLIEHAPNTKAGSYIAAGSSHKKVDITAAE